MAGSESAKEFFAKGGVPYADDLIRNEDGNVKALLFNAITVLEKDAAFINTGLHSALCYDDFRCQAMIRAHVPWDMTCTLPRAWTDQDDREVTAWLQDNHVNVGEMVAASAVQVIAQRNKYHPVLQFLAGLTWDGIDRLDEWLIRCCGVEDTIYTRAVGSKWMISGIARIMNPGCQADCVLVLEGPQGIRKTTTISVIGGAYYSNDTAVLGTTAAQEQILGKWIVELDELQAVTRASDIAAVTAFVSRRIDHFRLPYAHRSQDHRRQCIFAGTTNRDTWMRDETGGRRWWPVKCGTIDIDRLRYERDQLWAEAYTRFVGGEPWWLEDPAVIALAQEEQEARFEVDPWEESILDRMYELGISPAKGVTQSDLLRAIGLPTERHGIMDGARVQRIIRHLKWVKRRTQEFNGQRVWRYYPK